MAQALYLAVFLATLLWSGIDPRDRFTWTLEVLPAVAAILILAATRRAFPLTGLLYALILVHCVILMVGGHYTYAEVPLFDGLFGMERNNYDKLGHLAQGFVPAIAAREVLIRFAVVPSAVWRNVFIVSFCLAVSAFYELLEWLVTVLVGADADAFLGMQGYVWDTQADMAFALLGAALALAALSRWHDRQLRALASA